jgi:two-component system response regulator DesR
MKSVLIVEDHPLVARAMQDVLDRSEHGLKSHVCTDADETLVQLAQPQANWFRIFLDLDVPGAIGLSLARHIHGLGLHSRCCIVTALSRNDLASEVQSLGFLGYIVKAIPYVEFEKALHRILIGEPSFSGSVAESHHAPTRLTRRQEQLLDGVRRGLCSRDIAAGLFLSEGTVNNCINAAMRALNVTSRSHAVAKALELGLLRLPLREPEHSNPLVVSKRPA